MGYIIECYMVTMLILAIIACVAFTIFCILLEFALVILFAPLFLVFMFVTKLFKKE